jgi:hypothetical protein
MILNIDIPEILRMVSKSAKVFFKIVDISQIQVISNEKDPSKNDFLSSAIKLLGQKIAISQQDEKVEPEKDEEKNEDGQE